MKYRRFTAATPEESLMKAQQWESQHTDIKVVARLSAVVDGIFYTMLMYDFEFSTEYDDLLSLIK